VPPPVVPFPPWRGAAGDRGLGFRV
jgi:hypothetical protein